MLWLICFVWFDPLRPSQHSFNYVGMGLPVLNQYNARIHVFAKGYNAVTPVRLEPASLRSRVKHSTTESLRSLRFKCQSPTSYSKFYKNNLGSKWNIKHEESKHATDLRGLCLIHNNACAQKCKLVHDFLETETVVQLHHPSYSSDMCSCDLFLLTLLKINLSWRQC